MFRRFKGLFAKEGLTEPSTFTASWCSRYLHALESKGVDVRSSLDWYFTFFDPNGDNLGRLQWKLNEDEISADRKGDELVVHVKEDLHGPRLARLVLHLDQVRNDSDVFKFRSVEADTTGHELAGFPGLEFKQRQVMTDQGPAVTTVNQALEGYSGLGLFSAFVKVTTGLERKEKMQVDLHHALRDSDTVLGFEKALRELGAILFVGGMRSLDSQELLYLTTSTSGEPAIREHLEQSLPWSNIEYRIGEDPKAAVRAMLAEL